MAGKMCNLYLDEEVIEEIDAMARKLGVSRSRVANMTLKTAFGGQSLGDFYKSLMAGLVKREEGDEPSKFALT